MGAASASDEVSGGGDAWISRGHIERRTQNGVNGRNSDNVFCVHRSSYKPQKGAEHVNIQVVSCNDGE